MVLLGVYAAPAAPDDIAHRLSAAEQLYREGNYAGAETMLRAVLRDAERFEPDDPRRAIALNNLGAVYHFMNKYQQAESCYRRAVELEATMRWAGNDKPIRSVLNLAGLYIETGRYGKAERLGLRSLAEQEPISRRNGTDYAKLLSLLGHLEWGQARYLQAQQYSERALAIYRYVLPEGRETLETLNNLCVLYGESGRSADALSSCEGALRIAERMRNLEPSLHVSLLANVGVFQFLVHGPSDAEPFFNKALFVAENDLVAAHSVVGRILLSYAALLERTSRKTQAKEYRRRAKVILKAASLTDSRKYTVDLDDLLKKSSRR